MGLRLIPPESSRTHARQRPAEMRLCSSMVPQALRLRCSCLASVGSRRVCCWLAAFWLAGNAPQGSCYPIISVSMKVLHVPIISCSPVCRPEYGVPPTQKQLVKRLLKHHGGVHKLLDMRAADVLALVDQGSQYSTAMKHLPL